MTARCRRQAPPNSSAPPPAQRPDPLPGLEVTYLPKGAMRPGGPVGGADPRRHVWTYGARFMFPSGLTEIDVQVVCGPVAHDLRVLSQWKSGYGMRSTVVHGKPGLRHDSRPIAGDMAYDVMWVERPDIAIWVETSRDLGGQLTAIVNGIKVTG